MSGALSGTLALSPGVRARRRHRVGHRPVTAATSPGGPESAPPQFGDPEARPRWPQRRRESEHHRRQRLLNELAVLNERLRGGSPAEVARTRAKVEWLQRRSRRNWELITQYVKSSDGAVTLSLIEAANNKVVQALRDEARGSVTVSDLVAELQRLQSQLSATHERAHNLETRVSANLERVRQLEEQYAAAASGNTAALPVAADEASADACVVSTGGGTCVDPIEGSALRAAKASSPPLASSRQRRRGMSRRFADTSSLETPSRTSRLAHMWWPVQFLSKARHGEAIVCFGETWTLHADAGSRTGWRVLDPHARELPVCVTDGMLAVWPGCLPPRGPLPPREAGPLSPPKGYAVHAEIIVEDVPSEHGLLLENLLDLAHAPFTHTGTFAKGWSVPSAVSFAAAAVGAQHRPGDGWHDMGTWLAGGARGSWNPYPIDMTFDPPGAVTSHIGLAQAGAAGAGAQFTPGTRASDCEKHLHQLHVCVPSAPGRTRLLYRMALDFASWARLVPGMHLIWTEMASQVLGEDMRLLVGQQARLAHGSRVWVNPVAYDACGLAYRRFRNDAGKQYVPPPFVVVDEGREEDTGGPMLGSVVPVAR